ncbi:luciferin 4-monooxygenase-like [Epargyreus clarus]|uniref:luciferin 4-monooxygenase-like n=1 Tax=Epargyreus clarus TaxID=520877 RepID=UPI003C2FE9B6
MEAPVATPRKNLGHVFIDCMKEYADHICQIDAATGEKETNQSVLTRSLQLARCFRNFGLKAGDVLSLGGRNHLDLYIPFYASLINGMPISGVDPYFKFDEIKTLLTITRPKIAFCQHESYDYYTKALEDIGLEAKIITFDGQDNNLKQFIETYDVSASDIEPEDFDTSKIYAFLTSTSGTTGGLKVAAFTHDVVLDKLDFFRQIIGKPSGNARTTLHLSPVQWVSGFINALQLPLMLHTRLQTSKPDNEDHIIEVINKYKPQYCVVSPTLMTTLIYRKDDVDLTCFNMIHVTGSKVYLDTLQQFKTLLHEDAFVMEPYGVTEMLGVITFPFPGTPLGSCGIIVPTHTAKLIDPDTGKEIKEPKVTGELLCKGPGFTEYYNDPEATADAFTDDGFYKTGDLMYRDEEEFYYFVDRMKSLIKYRGTHVLPAECEEIILTHPGVRAACVCGVWHREDGQRAYACVVRLAGCDVTEQEIKDLVASKLSKNKQLHGGVIFVDELPMTSSGKVARVKVKEFLTKTIGED